MKQMTRLDEIVKRLDEELQGYEDGMENAMDDLALQVKVAKAAKRVKDNAEYNASQYGQSGNSWRVNGEILRKALAPLMGPSRIQDEEDE